VRLKKYAYKVVTALICVAGVFVAGCHGQGNISYYGTAWVSLTDEPGDYTSYIVTIDSVTLTRSDGIVVTATATPEIVDLAALRSYAELWSSESIPDGTYVSATITVDYTDAFITIMDPNGKPELAAPLDYQTGETATTYSITVNFDKDNQPTITPTYASTSAVLMSLDFDLAASGRVDVAAGVAQVFVRPVLNIGVKAADTKLIRVRGPLINSSTNVDTYTVYIRPFYDEANNIGTLTLFGQPNTIYTLNGATYVGDAGLNAIALLSAGSTITAAWTTFQTDYNPLNGATAGKFNLAYVVGGSTLEDIYTEGITGDVIARNGNTLTVQNSTLILNTADTFEYLTANAQVLVGPGTTVTADNNSTLTGLNYKSISVGQHITARGIYSILSDGTTTQIDSTGTSATNTGSVRLQATEAWGTLSSAANGTLTMNLETLNDFPVDDFTFTGNGTGTEDPTAFVVNTNSIGLPSGTVAGDPIWITGFTTPFGTAPPDFKAVSVNNELSVQLAGGALGGATSTAPGTETCGIGSELCDTAVLQVVWTPANKVTTPFVASSAAGFSIDLSKVYTAVIRVGPEAIDLVSLGTSPTVVPTTLAVTSTFAPRYMVGNPYTSTTTTTTTSTTAFDTFSSFPEFIVEANSLLSTTVPAMQLAAKGVYNRSTNTFTATGIDFVL
jgi:hypothetical protein